MKLNTAVSKIFSTPAVTFSLIGPPGSGKTSAPIAHAKALGMNVIRVDCANLPAEDLAQLPVLSDNKQTMHFAIPDKWVPKPNTFIILDELFKASDDTINAFLPLVHGKMLFGQKWPDETVVCVTANSAEFKVGDKLQPHSLNRLVALHIDDWSPAEALSLMLDLGFDARVIGWAEKVPSALVSYDAEAANKPESESDFYFGYSPKYPRRPFCSMRSLETASRLLQAGNTDSETLAGAIGKKAAASLSLFTREAQTFIDPKHILDGTAKAPTHLFDQRQAATTAVAILDNKSWKACLEFIQKLQPEAQLVAFNLISVKSNMSLVLAKREFNAWVAKVTS